MEPENDPSEFPEGGVWTQQQWVDRVNRGLEKTIVFVPNETMEIGINGVKYYVERDRETELPLPFYWQYQEAMKMRREAIPNAKAAMEKRAFGPNSVTVSDGWNGNVLE